MIPWGAANFDPLSIYIVYTVAAILDEFWSGRRRGGDEEEEEEDEEEEEEEEDEEEEDG